MSKSELPENPHPKQQALPNVIPELESVKKKLEIAMKAVNYYAKLSNWQDKMEVLPGGYFVVMKSTINANEAIDALEEINGIALSL